MSAGPVFLVGGGWDPGAAAAVHGPFLRAAGAARGTGVPRIGCVLVDEGDGAEQFARYDAVLRAVGSCAPVPLAVPLGGRFDAGRARGLDGLLVCGGLTPAYQEALAGSGVGRWVRESGLPYAGFSAGAAVAARRAVVGGWLDGGTPVCPADSAEDLAEIEVRDGLGLVPFAVDVHAAQWGTLARLTAAVARFGLRHAVAVDENTLVEVGADGTARVAGLGRAHSVRPAADGDGSVRVRSHRAGESFAVR
ncbi:hypothetical protein [Streptomyces sp. ACT015]|uniref:hypothetical protein n=1 Tax=Streptomyces sp. ACT015 TaxID=3134807 RepID=UPI003D176441